MARSGKLPSLHAASRVRAYVPVRGRLDGGIPFPDAEAAAGLFRGMLGVNGIALPASIYDRLGPLAGWLHIARAASGGDVDLRMMVGWIVALSVIASLVETRCRYSAAMSRRSAGGPRPLERVRFAAGRSMDASLAWAMVISVLATAAILHLGGQSESCTGSSRECSH